MESGLDLNTVWFSLVGVLLIGYAVLDGFDLGVGALHLFARGETERRTALNAIGPFWDGNEVWLVTGGGALFAAFPHVYATAFSGFYVAFMLFLFVIIFRATAIEFRGKVEGAGWRAMWDALFSAASAFIALLAGVALGNVARGIPIGPDKEFAGGFLGLLNPYALLVGLTTLALFAMHGAIYLSLKTEGEFNERVRGWAGRAVSAFIVLYVILTAATLLSLPHMTARFKESPLLLTVPAVTVLALANVVREMRRRRDLRALVSSGVVIAGLLVLFGTGIYPKILISTISPEYSLDIYNAASSQKTLKIMLTIAAIGMPLVVAYTAGIYWTFRGKVKLDETSY